VFREVLDGVAESLLKLGRARCLRLLAGTQWFINASPPVLPGGFVVRLSDCQTAEYLEPLAKNVLR
jgi:hypothetical protein